MEFDPLHRPIDQYRKVLRDWLSTPGLTPQEVALVGAMATGLQKSLEDFDQLRRIAVQPSFLPTLKSAAAKALAAGKLTSWSQYDDPIP